MSVLAYYKGTTIVPFDEKMLPVIVADSNKIIEDGLREGLDIHTIAGFAKERLDDLEKKLWDYQRKNPSGAILKMIGHPREWLRPAWGVAWEYYRIQWYIYIATLLRLKVIQNDEMNGWLHIKLSE